jgi:peptide/nickel transport system permease protein
MLLHGAKYTLLACLAVGVLRVVLGIAIGIGAAFSGPPRGRIESLGGLPSFIIVFFILGSITINSAIPLSRLFFFQVAVIALVGLPGVVGPFQARANLLLSQTFVEAARASGAGTLRIIGRHLLPHLRGDILIMLMDRAHLRPHHDRPAGHLCPVPGGTIFTASPPLLHSVSKEWAGMIGQARGRIMTAPWLLFVPLAAYFFVFLTFHLISGGLETVYRRRYEKAPYV